MSEPPAMGERRYAAICVAQRPGLVRLARRVVDDDAEDVVQEALLALHGQEVLEHSEPQVGAWLRRVCLNLSFNRARDRGRWYVRTARAGTLSEPVEAPPDPATEACRTDERHRVRQVLDELPERQRDVLLLRHAGYSYAEIAATLTIPAGSVGTTLARAERAFKARYSPCEEDSR